MAKILVVDDEFTIVQMLELLLKNEGHSVSKSGDGNEALRLLKENVFDLMITDVRLPGIDGIALLQKARDLQSHLAVIVITAYAGIDTAVDAMRNGAFDYVTKPFKLNELKVKIERALSYENALAENKVLKTTLKTKYHFNYIVGDSDQMLQIYRLIEKVAKTNSTVLIQGESGTGKELVARALHEASLRSDGPFMTVNCAAMPETLLESELFGYVKGAFTGANSNKKGLFEISSGGTIFLDEISSIPLNMQTKLLRVLQEKEIRHVGGTENISVDVRVVAATNEDLETKLAKGEFREDLYFRLSVIPVRIPPLRERPEDIPVLIPHFLSIFEKENKTKIDISPESIEVLSRFSWPGNIRQLENLLKRLATLNETGRIETEEIPDEIKNFRKTEELSGRKAAFSDASAAFSGDKIIPLKDHLKNIEDFYIRKAIKSCNGNKEKASKQLGISLATLYRKLETEGPAL
ncbi:MAG: hypothetical protein A2017_16190 [Lentisphaerae bacterium GWF2_44_16]|nr:MAG: hypothetical protein A2017_16190 [Lentisphaerae bacterium GWF2_44_16]